MIFAFAVVAALFLFIFWRERKFDDQRTDFAAERNAWVRERRDLNNRIAVPEAAPFIQDQESGPQENDIPIVPDYIDDQDEIKRIERELAEVGYEEGPAL